MLSFQGGTAGIVLASPFFPTSAGGTEGVEAILLREASKVVYPMRIMDLSVKATTQSDKYGRVLGS